MKKVTLSIVLPLLLFFTVNVQSQVNDNGTNVGIGTTAPPVAVGTATNVKLDVDGGVRSGVKGAQIAQTYRATSNYSSTNSTTTGHIGYNSNWAASSNTLGMASSITVSTARSSFQTSSTMAGRFITDLSGTSGSNALQIAGVYGNLKGAWAGNNSVNGGFAAGVVGVDEINGNNTFGGFFRGKGYFSQKLSVGTLNMPTTIGGTNISNYNLFVAGGILSDEVRVRTGWADYVFDDNYVLTPLMEVEAYINENNHLPNVPSAATVEEEGLSLGEITKIQQEKIEELMLYVIMQEKRIQALEAKINK
ncbi:hypothetical protein [uncultured Kordia sp.]|uniref:hypothetical protein n=1 Tax=uncultured Kordia sp. TaxID=507699 RepID=UPI00263604D1|nr:hypothetical protein [uncultured Kordia sp.]